MADPKSEIAPDDVDTIYTETAGTNCEIQGEHGYVTEVHSEGKHLAGAFVHVPPELSVHQAPGHMLYVTLGRAFGERRQHREVTGSRLINRDEFDRITGLDMLRRDLGWRGAL